MARRGRLELPVVGVAKSGWTLDQLVERARASLTEHGGGVDERAFALLTKRLRYVDGDYGDPATFARLKAELGEAKRPLHYLAIPPSMFPTVIGQLRQAGLHRAGARRRREAVRPRSRFGARAQRDHPSRASPRRRSSASITTSARRRCRTSSTSASPTRSSSRSGTGTTSRTCRSRWPRSFGVNGRGKFYDETGVIRDVIQNHLLQVVSYLAMEAPSATYAEAIRDEQAKVLRNVRPLERRPHGPRAVSRLSRRARRREGLVHGDLRRRSASTSTRGAGTASRSTCAPASRSPRRAPRSWSS